MTSKYFVFIIMAIIFVAGFSILQAATLEVPGTYATIQAGIDAASNGDTVNVAAGNYNGYGNEDINTLGKAILVKGVPDSTGCGRFVINTGEDTTTVIKGLIISGTSANGGAVYIVGSSPKMENCLFGGRAWVGGSIYIDGGEPVIKNCSFVLAKANKGAAIYVEDGLLALRQCFFFYNQAIDTFDLKWHYSGKGGALYAENSQVTISNCDFQMCYAYSYRDTITEGARGGVLYLQNTVAIIDSSYFYSNRAEQYYKAAYGGTIYSTEGTTIAASHVSFDASGGNVMGRALYQEDSCEANFEYCYAKGFPPFISFYSEGNLDTIRVSCCNFDTLTWMYGAVGDWADTLDNFSAEPINCGGMNKSQSSYSPNLPQNNDCGERIGAIGETGDANLDGEINLLDVLYLISYVYEYSGPPYTGYTGKSVFHFSKSVDCNGEVNLLDILCLMNHLYYDSCDLCDCD